jgi:GT2 family glycosyltransferase
VARIVIVDNNSIQESSFQLKNLANKYVGKIALISLDKNHGSAGGFKKGLSFAAEQPDCEFIWMLDDDNLPAADALNQLLNSYREINQNCCLVSLRKNRTPYRKVFNRIDVKRKFHPYNSFMDYNVVHQIRKKFLYSLKREKLDLIPIPYGPYGGMFFRKKMLEVIGYPNEEMFLYMDDHEFSHRIIKAGLNIFLNRKSTIEDMEVSWHGVRKYRFFSRFMLVINGDETKTYYLFRNLIYFENKYYVKNQLLYKLNMAIYKFVFYLLCRVLKRGDRIELFERAIADSKMMRF